MAFVVFSLFNIIIGVTNRSETETALTRTTFADRRQLKLLGLALLVTVLGTELGFLQRILGLTHLTGRQWLICILFAIGLLVIDEIVKIFLRRRRRGDAEAVVSPVVLSA